MPVKQSLQNVKELSSGMRDKIKLADKSFNKRVADMDRLVNRNDFDGLKAYIEGLLEKDFVPENFDESYQITLQKIKLPKLRALVASKLEGAKMYGVETGFLMKTCIQELPVDEEILITILNNLIDNAIEAAVESETPQMSIIGFDVNGDSEIRISNSFKEPLPDIERMKQYGFSTKGTKGNGLSEAVGIVRNNEHMQFNMIPENGYVVQILKIGREAID